MISSLVANPPAGRREDAVQAFVVWRPEWACRIEPGGPE